MIFEYGIQFLFCSGFKHKTTILKFQADNYLKHQAQFPTIDYVPSLTKFL